MWNCKIKTKILEHTGKEMVKILVVDDEEGIRRQLTAILREEGYSAESAANGAEAIAIMKKQYFDIVITDLMMPGIDGMELLRHIKKDYPNTVVVMITAHGSERIAVEAIKAGAYDYIPKPFSYPEEMLAVIERAVEHLRLKKESELFQQHLEQELAEAQRIQQFLLPQQSPSIDGLDIGIFSLPARQVGGDYHDFIELPSGELGIVVGDVSGKGMPAALLMASVQASLRAYAETSYSPKHIISQVNNLLYRYTESHKFVTLFYGVLNPQSGTLTYSNAGHNYPLIFRENEDMFELDSTGMPCGILENASYGEARIKMKRGDIALIYTDGITEAMNSDEMMFGEQRLKNVVSKSLHLDLTDLVNSIREELSRFVGNEPQFDDLTLVALKIK
jgi:sigma-B regulation protein RsbU (phosphoserine phosphatase)